MPTRVPVWIIGVGPLSVEYWKILTQLGYSATAIGRGAASAKRFSELTGQPVHGGGLAAFLASRPVMPDVAIVATGVDGLAAATIELLDYGVTRILVEKPGAMTFDELLKVRQHAQAAGADVRIGYNRRQFSSVLHAKRMIESDGGVLSFSFEFTEWTDRVLAASKAPGILASWVLGNSSHVIDLAFHLGGDVAQIECFTAGSFGWHPSAAVFSGAGRTDRNALFSYASNWMAPGRWSAEFCTASYRFIFRPMEQLQITQKGSVKVELVEVDNALDQAFKPGLFLQTKKFLEDNLGEICSLDEQIRRWPIYERIAGYGVNPAQVPPATIDPNAS